jgi:hypothetical protein
VIDAELPAIDRMVPEALPESPLSTAEVDPLAPGPDANVIVARPWLAVDLALPAPKLTDTGADRPADATITVRNIGPLPIRPAHRPNFDNVLIGFRRIRTGLAGWIPAAAITQTLAPGERVTISRPLQAFLYQRPHGPYYLVAKYDGPIGIDPAGAGGAGVEAEWIVTGEAVSRETSLVIGDGDSDREPPPDNAADADAGESGSDAAGEPGPTPD